MAALVPVVPFRSYPLARRTRAVTRRHRLGSEGTGPSPAGGPDEETVRALFARHWSGLCRLAGLILADHAAAEEVVQEAFLKTFDGWDRIRRPERADLYLRAAVVNLCRSRLRRRAREHRVNGTALALATTVEPTAAPERDPGQHRRVMAAVRSLPTRQRMAVVLRYYQDMSEHEIAETLGCSVGTVKSQLAKARRTLGRLLASDAPEGTRP